MHARVASLSVAVHARVVRPVAVHARVDWPVAVLLE